MIRTPSPADRAYAAGFFDGEGCLHIERTARGSYNLLVDVSQSVASPLLWLQARWGGSIAWRPPSLVHKSQGVWRVSGRRAHVFLLAVRPRLIVKAEQADMAILFAASRRHGSAFRWDLEARAENIREGQAARSDLINLRRLA